MASAKKVFVCVLSLAGVFTVFIALAYLAAGFALVAQVAMLIGLPLSLAALVGADRGSPRQPTMVVVNSVALVFQGIFWTWSLLPRWAA